MFGILVNGLYVVVCLLLLAVVLMQQGKGGDIASAFGGSGSQTAFGARAGATVLTRATSVLGVLFMVGAMALAIAGQRTTGSVLSGVDGPGLQPSAPVTVPVEINPTQSAPDETPTDAPTAAEPGETPAAPPAEPQ